MTTQAEAVARFTDCIAAGYRRRDSLSVEDAARAAYTPTGPSIPELEALIRAQRTGTPAAGGSDTQTLPRVPAGRGPHTDRHKSA